MFEPEKLMVATVFRLLPDNIMLLFEPEKLMVATVIQKALNAIVKGAHCFIGVKCFVSYPSCL